MANQQSAQTPSTSIPSHPAPKDPAATSSGVAANAQNPQDVPTTQKSRDWKPSYGRSQSYHKEDHKRELQMSGIGDVKTGPGFSEGK